jgi:N12 class adenine-specific DNA methylase
VSNTTTHGTARFRASDLVEQSLNGRTPTAYDEDPEGNRTVNQPETIAAREKQQQLKDRFGEWVWEDPIRAKRLADDYNFRFNNIRLRDFDGSHLTLPGMVRTSLRDGDLAPHQKNAVWRILQGGSPLLAHVVGAGIMPLVGLCCVYSRSITLVLCGRSRARHNPVGDYSPLRKLSNRSPGR